MTFFVIRGRNASRKTAQASLYLFGEYPDGQFSADLGGGNVTAAAAPSCVLRRFLAQDGVPAARVGGLDLAGLVELWRARTRGRRISIFLDDAVSAAQVRALLPGPGPAIVVVTTSRRLTWVPEDGANEIDADAP